MSTHNILIGMVGVAGSGKDTSGKLLQRELFKRRVGRADLGAFAAPLKSFIMSVFSLDHYNLYDNVGKEEAVYIKAKRETLRRNFNYHFGDICDDLHNSAIVKDNKFQIFNHYGEYVLNRPCSISEFNSLAFNKFLQVIEGEIYYPTMQRMFGLNKDYIYFMTTGRKLAQLIGTEFFRDYICKSTWVDIASTDNTIYCDVRFNEEANFIRNNGGVLIKVVNEKNTRNRPAGEQHESEMLIDTIKCDYTILNSGTSMAQLQSECIRVADAITGVV